MTDDNTAESTPETPFLRTLTVLRGTTEPAAESSRNTSPFLTDTPARTKSPTETMADQEAPAPAAAEHLNIKVTDNNNEVFFKIKRSTKLEKLMGAFCERQGKQPSTVRFLFDGTRVRPEDTPETLDMADGDTLEVHQEQIGG
ncbi:SUMO family protein SMT3 [Aspergillus stella-maris]|uniref:SUMO family protein SMT3 n=1 Tax=Aspergillus stella-maris TaxID=1810926 RepID=UPI003CCC902A